MASGPEIPISARYVSLAHSFATLIITFLLLSSAIFSARLYSRAQPVVHFGFDDWVAGVAYVSAGHKGLRRRVDRWPGPYNRRCLRKRLLSPLCSGQEPSIAFGNR